MRIFEFLFRSITGIACCAIIVVVLYALFKEDSEITKKFVDGHPERANTIAVLRNFWKEFFKNKIRLIAVILMGFGLVAWQMLLVVAFFLGLTYFLEYKFQHVQKQDLKNPKTSRNMTIATIILLVVIAVF